MPLKLPDIVPELSENPCTVNNRSVNNYSNNHLGLSGGGGGLENGSGAFIAPSILSAADDVCGLLTVCSCVPIAGK